MRVFLSGPMGSGKSTVARSLGARTHLPVLDVDALIEARSGRRASELFAEAGEAAFRALERTVLRELLDSGSPGVFALGGGAVTDAGLRRQLLASGTLITLTASPVELARRVGTGEGRPLLRGQNVVGRLQELLAARADAYAECHAELDTTGIDADEVATRVLEVERVAPVVVGLGRRTYRVEIGRGLRHRLPERVQAMCGRGRVIVVSDRTVGPLWADALSDALRAVRPEVTGVRLEPGEQHKNLRSVEAIWDAALRAGVERGSGVVGIGGGVVGDLSAFAASTLLRGIAVGHVPTTLLAMADAAIGGKTGFDTAQGKNLIGSFHQPSFVLCDVEVLATLPEAERRSGLAEVVKSAWIDGEPAVAQLERDAAALAAGDPEATVRAVRLACSLKARIVTEDERESGARALLNLGHTLGHAIEATLSYQGIRHGEAVALGMVAAQRVARRLGRAEPGGEARLLGLLRALGLPVEVDTYLCDEVLGFVGADKKRRLDRVRFVVPNAPGQVELQEIPLADLEGLIRP